MQPYARSQERGSVLIMGIMALVLLTALGIAATTSSVMENDITANERTHKEAFYAAELGLKTGENLLFGFNNAYEFAAPGSIGQYPKGQLANSLHDISWTGSDAMTVSMHTGVHQHSATGLQYVVEERDIDLDTHTIGIGVSGGINVYNIGAQGTGGHVSSKVVVSSIYIRRYF